ncbi:unnamed protein product [Kuraishia capsulata CBS 1993]|uniref:Uncharacterized protein n=1 Tax=Kuraishia capsulata CBS 1993 TaxID=1382522 RepID=W6MLR6_9ASCO|nr:uncharacterized protein KUCA_T00001777001 [Kuraishia capsulata CBS 1993]CDK25807.1 unnamed protein product [Kuraishia capsulata CBS 1993]
MEDSRIANLKRPSRLDLLDNNFTSFPLAHPISSSPIPTKTVTLARTPISRSVTVSQEDLTFEDLTLEQIVLVEDYIEEKNLKSKKKSVYDLKSEGALPNLTTSTKSTSTFSDDHHYEGLKYCVLCEKPLYELSSFIPEGKDFKELVCSSCILQYEQISNMLVSEEIGDDDESTIDTSFHTVRFKPSSEYLFDSLIQDLRTLQSQDQQRKLRSQKSMLFPMISESLWLRVVKFFKWS